MHPTYPLTRDVVLIGGGHAHALVLRKWGMQPQAGVRLTLITPDPTAPYTGMLPGFVAGHYERDALEIDMMRLARFARARVILGRVSNIDRDAKQITVAGRAPVSYDIASINIGITSDLPNLEGFARFGVGAKPLGNYAARWSDYVTKVAAGTPAQIAVIGGGVGGVELALAMHHRLAAHQPQIAIADRGAILDKVSPAARAYLMDKLHAASITLYPNTTVTGVTQTQLLTKQAPIASTFTIGAAGARPASWLSQTGLALKDGFVVTDAHLNAENDQAIFVAGDIAHLRDTPREKAGVFAVRQAPILYHNIRAAAAGTKLRRYRPQKSYLKLISTGPKNAVADWMNRAPQGPWLWTVKDRIDRQFMAKFERFPAQPDNLETPIDAALGVQSALNATPLCGGCGAKVGAQTLAAQLAKLPSPTRADVAWGAGDDAALLQHKDGFQALTTDHFRAFIDDPWLLTRITAIHAMGDIWAMGGTPQAALSTITLPKMSDALQSRSMAEILDAAHTAFGQAGADLVGGHSGLGAELMVGFSLTGLVQKPIGLAGAQPGDALILTKPIGTGVIMAADMRALAPGTSVKAALAQMSDSSAGQAAILAPVAHAMTDVTGFGLAGHLLGILDASDMGADLSAIPVIEGAIALSELGIRSSLFTHNSMVSDRIEGTHTALDIMFDPQTAGGLLAAVPADQAERVIDALNQKVPGAIIIGTVTAGPAKIRI